MSPRCGQWTLCCLVAWVAAHGCGSPEPAVPEAMVPAQPPEPAPGEMSASEEVAEPSSEASGEEADETQPHAPLSEARASQEFEAQASEEFDRLLAIDTSMVAALSENRCGEAERFRRQLCELAERICTIADELPGSTDVGMRCRDGRQRCTEASRRHAQHCE